MTNGISPKVALPGAVLTLAGAVLLAIGLLKNDDTLTTAGVTALGAAGVQIPVGYRARPGDVAAPSPNGPGSDELLPPEALESLA